MKRLLILILILSFWGTIEITLSQEGEKDLLSNKETFGNEYKGENNTYMVDTVSFLCRVSNKISCFGNTSSNIGPGDFKVRIEDSEIVKQIFRNNLSEHFKKYQLNDKDNLTLALYADMSGKIRDVSFMYNAEWDIPIAAFEQIEQKIKEQGRLTFDKNTPALSHANYVSYFVGIYIKGFCYSFDSSKDL